MDPQKLIKPLLVAGGLAIVFLALGVPTAYLAILLLIVACPLMMFFMMRGMDHGGTAGRDSADEHISPTHEHH